LLPFGYPTTKKEKEKLLTRLLFFCKFGRNIYSPNNKPSNILPNKFFTKENKTFGNSKSKGSPNGDT